MTPEELHQTFVASGLSCRAARTEVALEVCYFCGNDRFNLECSAEKGVYHCWACKAGGRLSDLLQKLTGQQHNIPVQRLGKKERPAALPVAAEFQSSPISAVFSAEHYLKRRGITSGVAAQYGMVVCSEKGHPLEGRIAVPLREYWTGTLVGWVGRSYTGKVPKYISTLPYKMITGWRTRDRDDVAVLVEGPFDGCAVHRAGYQAAVLSGVGGEGVLEWAARVDPRATIAILLDGDALHQAHRIYWQIKPVVGDRVCIIPFQNTSDDPAQVGPEGIRSLIDQALRARGHT